MIPYLFDEREDRAEAVIASPSIGLSQCSLNAARFATEQYVGLVDCQRCCLSQCLRLKMDSQETH